MYYYFEGIFLLPLGEQPMALSTQKLFMSIMIGLFLPLGCIAQNWPGESKVPNEDPPSPLLVADANTTHHRRPRPELRFDWAPSQITASYRYTVDDYSLLTASGQLQRTRLNGGAVEFAWHRLYPWEAVGTIGYSRGEPLGQTLATAAAGVGYTRVFSRLMPYARFQVGVSRTASNDYMYLSPGPQWGLVTIESVGLEYRISPHWGIRLPHLQNEYLPFGSHSSVYWSSGAGITYDLRP